MRLLPWFILAISLTASTEAQARLFWQTYGATVPAAEGACNWNVNQDYFVPRHPASCRYELYSPCKSSRYRSPACKSCHPIYSGYCNIYGPCHYRHRNHVYQAYCGCSPVPIGCGTGCQRGGTSSVATSCGWESSDYEPAAPLHPVEPSHLEVLGSIPVEGGQLLSGADFLRLGSEQSQGLLQGSPGVLPQLPTNLPSLSGPSVGPLTLPVSGKN